MSETLGARILDAAQEWASLWSRVKPDDDLSFALEDDAHERLRALCARADAAERLAVAIDDFHAACLDIVITQIVPRERDEEGEFKQALAAWRALGEVDG